jgi:hypothetical protein
MSFYHHLFIRSDVGPFLFTPFYGVNGGQCAVFRGVSVRFGSWVTAAGSLCISPGQSFGTLIPPRHVPIDIQRKRTKNGSACIQ